MIYSLMTWKSTSWDRPTTRTSLFFSPLRKTSTVLSRRMCTFHLSLSTRSLPVYVDGTLHGH
ncbi:hypothetical protein B0H19DRAFT_1186284, partial [Mycena capillaripes]